MLSVFWGGTLAQIDTAIYLNCVAWTFDDIFSHSRWWLTCSIPYSLLSNRIECSSNTKQEELSSITRKHDMALYDTLENLQNSSSTDLVMDHSIRGDLRYGSSCQYAVQRRVPGNPFSDHQHSKTGNPSKGGEKHKERRVSPDFPVPSLCGGEWTVVASYEYIALGLLWGFYFEMLPILVNSKLNYDALVSVASQWHR
jgi:hypothetical protein